jgi:hypothetical protein
MTKEEMKEMGDVPLPPPKTLDIRPLTLDRRRRTEVWCLKSEVHCLNCRSSLEKAGQPRRNERSMGSLLTPLILSMRGRAFLIPLPLHSAFGYW